MSTTSLLHTALQNLHVNQQILQQSHTPIPPGSPGSETHRTGSELASSYDGSDDEEELVGVGQGTRPATPLPGLRGGLSLRREISGQSGKIKDPLRTLPTHLAVRVFLQLDIRTLARCNRVCKRWNKSSTLNYVWFLQNRALTLPHLSGYPPGSNASGKIRRLDTDTPEFFDPYDKTPRLSSLPTPALPNSQTPVWSKLESKKQWKTVFHGTLKRSDPNAEEEIDSRRVDIASLHSSGRATPSGGHAHAGSGSGGAAKWVGVGDEGGMTPTERKLAAREGYKAMGGRKSRSKRKMGGEMGARDKGGAVDDGRFDAPW
ncbi:hypothetical protein BCR39DRAFT_551155 [Naematelia encephala]|uniref:F-box domain-containing protein n=1 Tax=Naematelia encephala TaxID=71784 RepID=A0A1Y2AKY5_9TREE|nr:hypothetical protein BCR39DRAFT_551155 [Naematelia encephala]